MTITVQECIYLCEVKGFRTLISNGKISGFIYENNKIVRKRKRKEI